MSAPRPTSAPRSSMMWLLGLACGALATLATPTAILAAILLGPALLAWMIDRSPGRPIARAVMLCGLAGAIRPFELLWQSTQSTDTALAIASDVRMFVIAWSAQAAGWLGSQVIPVFMQLALESAAVARGATLRHSRARYAEEWDLPEPPLDIREAQQTKTAASVGGGRLTAR